MSLIVEVKVKNHPLFKRRFKIFFISSLLFLGLGFLIWGGLLLKGQNQEETTQKFPSSESSIRNGNKIKEGKGQGARMMPPVRVSRVRQQDVPIQVTAIGMAVASETVHIFPRVSGELVNIHFTEGSEVKAGDILFSLDPANYEIALSQAKGQLLKDEANLLNAKTDLKRLQQLKIQGAASEQSLTTQVALIKQLEGAVKTSQALVDKATLDLSYTKIQAPIDGTTGLVATSIGNYLQSNSEPLVTLTQIDPIEIMFSLPERMVPDLQKSRQQGEIMIEILDSFREKILAQGRVKSWDNQIDSTTGTLEIKGLVDNLDKLLFPNQFVNLNVILGQEKNALTLPISAIQTGSDGDFVWRVNEKIVMDENEEEKSESIVEKILIKTGSSYQNEVIILSGLSSQDKVVTQGVDRLSDGMRVNIVNPD